MEEKNELLPVQQKDSKLLKQGKIVDNIRRTGRAAAGIIGGSALMVGGVAVQTIAGMAIGGPIGAAIGSVASFTGMATGMWSFVRGGMNALYRTDPNLMFVGRKEIFSKKIDIKQDTKLNLAAKMKGYDAFSKAGMMQLQTLVGFSKYKDELEGASYTIRPDGTKVYDQEFTTVTHTVNLKTFDALEALGLIEITEKDDMLSRTLLGKPKPKKSLLLVERIGFQNKDDLDKIKVSLGAKLGIKFTRKGKDGEKIEVPAQPLDDLKKTMERRTFKLTDKAPNFDEYFAKINGIIPFESPEEKEALKTFRLIFSERLGVLGRQKIDIGKDRFGRDVIIYDAEENFATRFKRENDVEKLKAESKQRVEENVCAQEKLSEFDKYVRQGVDQTKVNEVIAEHREEVRKDLADDGKINGSTVKIESKEDKEGPEKGAR